MNAELAARVLDAFEKIAGFGDERSAGEEHSSIV